VSSQSVSEGGRKQRSADIPVRSKFRIFNAGWGFCGRSVIRRCCGQECPMPLGFGLGIWGGFKDPAVSFD
jgi:hypothetical protein